MIDLTPRKTKVTFMQLRDKGIQLEISVEGDPSIFLTFDEEGAQKFVAQLVQITNAPINELYESAL